MKIELFLKSIFWLGLTILSFITACSLISIIIYRWYEIDVLEAVFQRLIGFDQKQTFSTWYSSSALLVCSGLIWLISQLERQYGSRYAIHWTILIYVFLFLSVDKTVGIHHAVQHDLLYRLPKPIRFEAWLLHGIELVVAILFISSYLRPFLSLPTATKYILVVACFLYLIAPAVADLLIDSHPVDTAMISPIANLAELLEETLEMLGALLFVHGFLKHLSGYQKPIQFAIANK